MTIRAFNFVHSQGETDPQSRHDYLQMDPHQDAVNRRAFEKRAARDEHPVEIETIASDGTSHTAPKAQFAWQRFCAYVGRLTRQIPYRHLDSNEMAASRR